MLVQSTPPNAKQQDQNKAAVGPTRVNVEEQVKQVLDAKPTIDFTLPQTGLNYGTYAAGYWYTSEEVGKGTLNTFSHSAAYAFPITVRESSVIDAMGVCVTDNASGDPNHYYARIGLYAEIEGVPVTKVAETSEFNYGDSSMTNVAFNTLTLAAPVVLVAGRYWLLFVRSSTSNLANPANIRWRSSGGQAFIGPMRDSEIYASAATINGYTCVNPANPTGAGPAPWSTVLPDTLDFWSIVVGPTTNTPEIWLRGA